MLRASRWALKALIVLNVFVGIPLLLLLCWSFIDEQRFLGAALRVNPGAEPQAFLTGLRIAFATIAPVMIAVLLIFVLVGVFREGARLRVEPI